MVLVHCVEVCTFSSCSCGLSGSFSFVPQAKDLNLVSVTVSVGVNATIKLLEEMNE